jgi:aminomethyltransferase
MGLTLPAPGLHSKFLDQEQQTLIEVVQDTVGRHDSFLFACSPKYYEDQGYFGHLSCTENFNNALKPYGIKPRFGWPAINFFFNTYAEPCGTIAFSEPWSRPGDYVLLRASRDLLCASSACPDDIDPANGWQPTDIHVRVYAEDAFFPRSIAYRTIPEELPRMTIQSGFHSRTSTLTKHFSEYKGYWVATEYEGWGANAEYLACREKVAMIDLTALRKFEVVGPDAEVFMQYAVTRNVRRMSVGEIVYSAICSETGGMIDDGTLFKMSNHAFRWVCGDPYTGKWLIDLAQKTGHNVKVRESSNQIHNIAVQGPKSRELLKDLVWTPEYETRVEALSWFHFTIGRLGDSKGFPIMVSRTGYTGELGFEVWCHPDDSEALWDVIWDKGQAYGIAPMGFDALDKLRIEAGLIFAEHEFCPKTNPFEAGIGFTTPLKTNDEDFIGRQAIESQSPESRHKLMGLVIESNEPIHHGDEIFHGRFPVGVVTSATFSPILKKQIALCRLAPGFAKLDTELEIGQLDGQQKRITVKVVSLPFYDPERTKVRS